MLKKIKLIFILIFLFESGLAQDATEIYNKNVNSTVTIETEDGLGSGFFVGENIIATNYHVIEGATSAFCYTNNSTTKFKIEGYLAVDKSVDLVLLKVIGLNKPSIKVSMEEVSPGQKIYVLGSPKGLPATISDGIVSGLRNFEGYKLIQITAPISPGSSGGPVLNSKGELIGISVGQFKEGQNLNFAIPKSNLELLIKSKKNYPTSLSSIYTSNTNSISNIDDVVKNDNINKEDKIIRLGLHKIGSQDLSLDYFANFDNHSVFFFTYSFDSKENLYEKIFMDDYRLVDLENGDIYYATKTDLPKAENPRIVYNGTKTGFSVRFNRLPSKVRRFSLMEGECSENSFCFLDIDIRDFDEAEDFNFDFYNKTESEGTVSFYSDYGNSGDIKFYIDDVFIGKLTSFYKDKNYDPKCGENGTLTVRLNAGTYNYKAHDDRFTWEGRVTIKPNTCVIQGITGK